ncbi:MAG: GTPase [Patescibacteria group bacterium]|nr:GTPase [Patescibacteria group bacterium]
MDDFNIRINAVAGRAIGDADAVVRFVDSSRPFGDEERKIDELVANCNKPVLKVFSKWDVAMKGVEKGSQIAVSSVNREGFKELVEAVTELLPEGVPFYGEDYYTDQDPYTRVSEIIREKAFQLLSEEIPHDLYVNVEEFEEEGGLLRILAYLVVERDSQKRIAVGKGGEVIRQIGMTARLDLEKIFDKKIFLALRVKVDPHWKKNRKLVDSLLK